MLDDWLRKLNVFMVGSFLILREKLCSGCKKIKKSRKPLAKNTKRVITEVYEESKAHLDQGVKSAFRATGLAKTKLPKKRKPKA